MKVAGSKWIRERNISMSPPPHSFHPWFQKHVGNASAAISIAGLHFLSLPVCTGMWGTHPVNESWLRLECASPSSAPIRYLVESIKKIFYQAIWQEIVRKIRHGSYRRKEKQVSLFNTLATRWKVMSTWHSRTFSCDSASLVLPTPVLQPVIVWGLRKPSPPFSCSEVLFISCDNPNARILESSVRCITVASKDARFHCRYLHLLPVN